MVNMKRPKKKRVRENMVSESPYDEEKYPYGLQINFENEELDKLGIDVKDFEVNEKIKFTCKAEISSLSSNKREKGERQNMSLQITDLEFNLLAGLSLKQLKALNE